jgi:hypothetical protein
MKQQRIFNWNVSGKTASGSSFFPLAPALFRQYLDLYRRNLHVLIVSPVQSCIFALRDSATTVSLRNYAEVPRYMFVIVFFGNAAMRCSEMSCSFRITSGTVISYRGRRKYVSKTRNQR